jgi:hypothetical protein
MSAEIERCVLVHDGFLSDGNSGLAGQPTGNGERTSGRLAKRINLLLAGAKVLACGDRRTLADLTVPIQLAVLTMGDFTAEMDPLASHSCQQTRLRARSSGPS